MQCVQERLGLAAWLGPENVEFREMGKRAKAIGQTWQDALFRIVEDLAAMVVADDSSTTNSKNLHSRQCDWEIARGS